MYAKEAELAPDRFYQGDIIRDFPFTFFSDEEYPILNELAEGGYEISREARLPAGEQDFLVAAKIQKTTVAILTQTCDIENKDYVVVAPVYTVRDYIELGILTESNAGLLRKKRDALKDWFYLSEKKDANNAIVFEESFIDLQKIIYCPKNLLRQYVGNRVVGLSDWGRHLFSWAISDYLGRPIEDKYR